ncbi:MAG: glycoside hydrolase family 18 protein [Cellulosilyticaceae bacterium]
MLQRKVIAGYVNSSDRGGLIPEDIKKLTHINLAFGHIDQGEIHVNEEGLLGRLQELKGINPELKISLSLVGKTGADFPVGSATEEGRQRIANACVKVLTQYDLDGIDLDWEYPCCPENYSEATPEDKYNFTYLCEAIRKAIDTLEGHKLLTIAAGGDRYYTDSTEMDKVEAYLDLVYIMTYDLRCGFHSLTGHHTNLFTATGDIFRTSCDEAVKIFVGAGVPKEKIVIGAAFYSRKWEEVPNRYNGFLQYTKISCTYGPCYHDLVANYINKNGYTRYWDDECKAPYLFNGSTFISYDDPESLTHKVDYIKNEGIAGIFYWEHDADMTHTLLDAIYTAY